MRPCITSIPARTLSPFRGVGKYVKDPVPNMSRRHKSEDSATTFPFRGKISPFFKTMLSPTFNALAFFSSPETVVYFLFQRTLFKGLNCICLSKKP